jgi:glycerol-3-phosphate acyltransferase PlsX
MKIAIDAMGGDFAPQAVIEGALLASKELSTDVKLVLIGREQVIHDLLHTPTLNSDTIEVVNADEVVEMGEHPTKALTQKTKSSIAIGYAMLKAGQVNAFCSAGNTGSALNLSKVLCARVCLAMYLRKMAVMELYWILVPMPNVNLTYWSSLLL